MYTFNILLLSNRDSLAWAEQVYETLAFAQLQAVIRDVGYSPELVTVARRDLRNVVPDGLTGKLTAGAERLLAGADVIVVAVSDPTDPVSGVLGRIESVREIARSSAIPVVVWGSQTAADSVVFSPHLAARIYGVDTSDRGSAFAGGAPLKPVGVVVSSVAPEGHDSWVSYVSQAVGQGHSVTIIPGGLPDDDSAAAALGLRCESPQVKVLNAIDSQREFVNVVGACRTIAADSPAVAIVATALGTQVCERGARSADDGVVAGTVSGATDGAEATGSEEGTEANSSGQSSQGTLPVVGQVAGSAAVEAAAQLSYQRFFEQLLPVLSPSTNRTPSAISELAKSLVEPALIDELQEARLRALKTRRVEARSL